MLPINVLTDLVRSYTNHAQSVVPDFLASSFEMLRDGQSQMMENLGTMNPMANMPGFEIMKAQQEAFMKTMTAGVVTPEATPAEGSNEGELAQIKEQLAELQAMMSKIGK